jgi:hypothetical protein
MARGARHGRARDHRRSGDPAKLGFVPKSAVAAGSLSALDPTGVFGKSN